MDSIFIVVAFFIAVSLLSIPCMMYYKKKEKKEHQLISENRDQAVLQIYGDPIRIDGKIFSEYEHMGSKLSYYTVVLPEGCHTLEAKFQTTSAGVSSNQNYKTPEPIPCDLFLEKGFVYTAGIYFYSPKSRYEYYKGEVGEAVFSKELSVTGSTSYGTAYVIVYKDKDADGNLIKAPACPEE